MSIPFTMTQDAITVVVGGKVYTVQANTPQYHGLRDCIFREDWPAISTVVSKTGAIQQWLGDKFVVEGDWISYEGSKLPASIVNRIWAMASAGESPGPLFAFYERLAKNPSYRSVQQLWDFLAHVGIPLEPDGTFLAYKGVREDFFDKYTNTLCNEPGTTQRFPRNQISDDADLACHVGLHVGTLSYARNFADRVVVCRIDPEHVVCVPNDHSAQKMRVCEYHVTGHWIDMDAHLSSTVAHDDLDGLDEADSRDADWGGDVEYEDEHEVDTVPAPRVVAIATSKPTAPKASSFNRKNPTKLMESSIEDLRKYASAHLKIVGAYKMPGGKAKLVSAILKARRKRSR